MDSIKQPVAADYQNANIFPWNVIKYAAQIRIFAKKICDNDDPFGKVFGRLSRLMSQVTDDLLEIH